MRRITLFCVLLIPMLVFVISCDVEIIENARTSVILADIHDNFDIIGEEHNAGLEYNFGALENDCIDTMTSAQIEQIIYNQTYNFIDSIASLTSNQKDGMASVVDSIIHDFVQYFQDSTTTDYLMEYVIDKYSIAEYKKEYLLWIDSIVVDENLSYNQTIDDLEDLYLIVHGDSTLDDDDKSLVYSTISIAQHSSEYWYGQYEDWGNLN